MVHCLRTLAAPLEDPSSIPSTHIAVHNCSGGLLLASKSTHSAQTYIQAKHYTHKIIIRFKNFKIRKRKVKQGRHIWDRKKNSQKLLVPESKNALIAELRGLQRQNREHHVHCKECSNCW